MSMVRHNAITRPRRPSGCREGRGLIGGTFPKGWAHTGVLFPPLARQPGAAVLVVIASAEGAVSRPQIPLGRAEGSG